MRSGQYTIETLEPRRLFAVVLTVTNTNDSGDGSLRAAINNANVVQTPQSAAILFNIPGSGVHTIKPASQLPTITVQLDLEGTTDSKGNPLIEIDGEDAGDVSGLVFNRNTNGNDKPSIVSGLVINRFEENGIVIGGSGPTDVYGCRIGTDPTGTIAEKNLEGIAITGNNNQIGMAGSGAAFQTIISGNMADGVDIGGNDNIVQNCSVGADANGEGLGNGGAGIGISGSYNLIGGTRPGEGNQIVDNSPGLANPGIFISGQFNVVLSNTIDDNTNGIELDGASNNEIGDGSDADRNFINGSREGVGIGLTDSSTNNLIDDNVIGYNPFDKVVAGNQIGVAIVNSS
ncbi:MAG TPA: hypothetical protein VKK61_10380, partial [Tepidisphaeraceae bacterium]|nr:hypothetical protein [Tepidisphaeraceae bacterium]